MTELSVASNIYLNVFEQELLGNALIKYQTIIVEKEFGGGYSDTRVFLILPVMHNGRSDARIVVKIGLGQAIELQQEKENYDNFAGPALPFSTTKVKDFYAKDGQAAITYIFTGGESLGKTITLDEYYRDQPAETVNKTLNVLLDQALGPAWYAQNQPYHCLFRDEYGHHLLPRDELKKIVSAIYPRLMWVDERHIQIPGVSTTYPDPLSVFPKLLDQTLNGKRSMVHGDLHVRNVLVDASGKGWLIDFAKVKERHNLFDFIKLETYIRLMTLGQIAGAFSLSEYTWFEESLNKGTLQQQATPPTNPELLKAGQVIQNIRQIAKKYMGHGGTFNNEYFPALFLYALSMLKYFSVNGIEPTQLMYITACVLGKFITEPNELTTQNKETADSKIANNNNELAFISSEYETQVTILLQNGDKKSSFVKQSSFLLALSRILNIDPDEISIFRVSPASMGITLIMPRKSALKLMHMWFSENLELKQLNILKMAFEQEKNISEVNKMAKNKNSGQGGINIGGNATGNIIITGDHSKVDQKNLHVNTGGGTYFGGNVNVTNGDFVGHDKITNQYGSASAGEIAEIFKQFLQRVEKMESGPKKNMTKTAVQDLETETMKGEQAVEKDVTQLFDVLALMAPDIFDVVVNTLASPIKGLSTIIQKIAIHLRETRKK